MNYFSYNDIKISAYYQRFDIKIHLICRSIKTNMLTTEMEVGGYVVFTKSRVDIRQNHIRQGREEVANKIFIRSHFLSLSPLYPTCENLVLGIGFILIFIVSSNQLIEIIYGNGKRSVFFY